MSSVLAAADPNWRQKCHGQRHKTLRQRFNEKTVRDSSGCLIWTGGHDKDGYGFIRIDGKNVKAHRVALEWKLDRPLAVGEQALHRCDRPACVEPEHLFSGTNSDNQVDCVLKGRNPHQRLNIEDIREIRRRRASGETGASLARTFGVHGSYISAIVKKVKWRHVA